MKIETIKNPVKNRKKTELKRDKKGLFIEGTAPGPGRTLGLNDFATDFNEAVAEIAKAKKITLSKARKILLKKAFFEAKKGNFPYYKDIHDRIYGKAQEKVDITSGGKPIPILGNVYQDKGDQQNNKSNEENPGDSGGDSGE